jgi:hypothetical protein
MKDYSEMLEVVELQHLESNIKYLFLKSEIIITPVSMGSSIDYFYKNVTPMTIFDFKHIDFSGSFKGHAVKKYYKNDPNLYEVWGLLPTFFVTKEQWENRRYKGERYDG